MGKKGSSILSVIPYLGFDLPGMACKWELHLVCLGSHKTILQKTHLHANAIPYLGFNLPGIESKEELHLVLC